MIKKILCLFVLIFLVGCSTQEKIESNEELENNPNSETISLCKSLCRINAEDYCNTERTITVNGEEKTGTCRSFAKMGRVDGFVRCKEFCVDYGKIE